MHKSIQVRSESKRDCGWRKVGGKYLAGGDADCLGCGRLPIPIEHCPCCGHGFKPARGWTWVDADRLIRACAEGECNEPESICLPCPISTILLVDAEHTIVGMAGMIWVGERFYKTPKEFNIETAKVGISRRINTIPRDFELGKTYVLLAHRKAIHSWPYMQDEDGKAIPTFQAGIFRVWKPTAIEVIVDGTESDEVVDGYLERGLTPVKIERVEDGPEQTELELE